MTIYEEINNYITTYLAPTGSFSTVLTYVAVILVFVLAVKLFKSIFYIFMNTIGGR